MIDQTTPARYDGANGHHSAPACARHGIGPHQIDPSAGLIRIFERLGWATAVHWPTPHPPTHATMTGRTCANPRGPCNPQTDDRHPPPSPTTPPPTRTTEPGHEGASGTGHHLHPADQRRHDQRTKGGRLADTVTPLFGSWRFIRVTK